MKKSASGGQSKMFSPVAWTLLSATSLLFLLTSAELPESFGVAHQFTPLPRTTIGSHCRWEIKLDTVFNRIPSTITEVVCQSPYSSCGGNSGYQCRQVHANMVVAHFEPTNPSILTHKSNISVAIGCSCVMLRRNSVDQYGRSPMHKRNYYYY